MRILLHDKRNSYNLVDYENKCSTGWQSFIPTIKDFVRNELHSWYSAQLDPFTRIKYLQETDNYTIISIDDIPFAEWSAQHPEYFI